MSASWAPGVLLPGDPKSARVPPCEPPHAERAGFDQLLSPWECLVDKSPSLLSKPAQLDDVYGARCVMPRFLFLGPNGGGETFRIGLFALIRGTDLEGTLALTRLANELVREPDLARDYALFFYPVCNPTGFEDGTSHARNGSDLNAEFWRGSAQPEVQILEREIWTHAFHGIITLHSDQASTGFYGTVNGEVLSKHLLEPALRSADTFLARNRRPRIDGQRARNGIIYQSNHTALRAPPGLKPLPFEVALITPSRAPLHLQLDGLAAALKTILAEFRNVMAHAQNI
jgi:murein peptide amidase A